MHLPNSLTSTARPEGLEHLQGAAFLRSDVNIFKPGRMNAFNGNHKGMAITVLILEDNVGNLSQLDAFFRSEMPDIHALTASSVDEAHLFMSEYPEIKLFIIGGHVGGGTGVDFLGDMKTVIPDAKAILMEDNPFHEHNDRTRELGIVDYIDIPINFQILKAKINNHLSTGAKGEGFQVMLSNVTLDNIVQIKCRATTPQAIDIQCEEQFGKLFFDQGKIIYAEASVPGLSQRFGIDALEVIAGWPAGHIVENHQSTCPPYRRIAVTFYDFLSIVPEQS